PKKEHQAAKEQKLILLRKSRPDFLPRRNTKKQTGEGLGFFLSCSLRSFVAIPPSLSFSVFSFLRFSFIRICFGFRISDFRLHRVPLRQNFPATKPSCRCLLGK